MATKGRKPTNHDELRALPPVQRLKPLSKAMENSAKRCKSSVFLSGTWVQSTFKQMAEELKLIEKSLSART